MTDMTKVRYVRPAPHCNVTVRGLVEDTRFNNFEGDKVFDLYVLFGGNEPLARERIEKCVDLSKSIDAKHLRVVQLDESVEEVEVIKLGTIEEPATREDIEAAKEEVVKKEVTTEEEETADEDDGGDTREEPAEEVKEETTDGEAEAEEEAPAEEESTEEESTASAEPTADEPASTKKADPLTVIHGIGPKTAQIFAGIGVTNIGELVTADIRQLIENTEFDANDIGMFIARGRRHLEGEE